MDDSTLSHRLSQIPKERAATVLTSSAEGGFDGSRWGQGGALWPGASKDHHHQHRLGSQSPTANHNNNLIQILNMQGAAAGLKGATGSGDSQNSIN